MWLALEVIAALGAFYLGTRVLAPGIPADFYQFWSVGIGLSRPGTFDLYIREEANQMNEWIIDRAQDPFLEATARKWKATSYTATPLFYLVAARLSTPYFGRDFLVFYHGLLAIYVLSVLVLGRLFAVRAPLLLILMPVMVVLNRPLASDIYYGNISQLQVGMIALTLWLLHKPTSARIGICGAVVSFSILFKPTLVLAGATLFCALVIRHRTFAWAFLAGAIPMALVCVAAPELHFDGKASWMNWVGRFQEGMVPVMAHQKRSMVAAIFGISVGGIWKALSAGFVLLPVFAMLYRRHSGRNVSNGTGLEYMLAYLCGIVAMFLSAPVVHDHYFLMLTACAIYAFGRPVVWGDARNALIKVVLLSAFVLGLTPTLMSLASMRLGFIAAILCYAAFVVDLQAARVDWRLRGTRGTGSQNER